MNAATLTPPGMKAANHGFGSWIMPRPEFTNESEVLNMVASEYRYRFRLRLAVRKDLMRWACVHSIPLYMEVYRGKPYPVFLSSMAEDWLEAGGRAFIIAELEKNSSRRVVAFPGGRANG